MLSFRSDLSAPRVDSVALGNEGSCTGVAPLGAQVLTRFGISKKPLSLRKTRWAPSLWAFFDLRPLVPLPRLNHWLIALWGSAFWLLATPPPAHPQRPHMTRRIAHLETWRDDFSYPSQGPKSDWVACLKRARLAEYVQTWLARARSVERGVQEWAWEWAWLLTRLDLVGGKTEPRLLLSSVKHSSYWLRFDNLPDSSIAIAWSLLFSNC